MPVSSHHVPLDTAKSWAKRLARFSRDRQTSLKLHQAQAAVADMLGFVDWHALTQKLSQASNHPTPPIGFPPLSRPTTPAEWTALWQTILADDDTIDIHFEQRRGVLRIRVRKDGVFQYGWADVSMEALESLVALAGLCPPTAQGDFFGMEYSVGNLGSNSSNPRYRFLYQSLPTYPEGRDVVVARSSLRPRSIPNDWFPEHQQRLKEHLYAGPGLVVVAGTSSSGRTSFALHLMEMARQHNPKQQMKTLVVSNHHGHEISPEGSTHVSRIELGTRKELVDQSIRNGMDLLFIDDLCSHEEMTLVVSAVQRGTLVFATLDARSERSALQRLQDYAPQQKSGKAFAQELQLRISTYVKMLPLICSQCSTTGTPHQERGPGCVFCKGTGSSGRTLQAQAVKWEGTLALDLWPRWEQVHRLLAEKKISGWDVEEFMGPEPLDSEARKEEPGRFNAQTGEN